MKHKTRIRIQDVPEYSTLMVYAYVDAMNYLQMDGTSRPIYNGRKIEYTGLNELRLYFDYEDRIWTSQWLCLDETSSSDIEHTEIPYITGLTEEEQFQLSTVWEYEVKLEHVQYLQDYALRKIDTLDGGKAVITHEELDFNILDSWIR
ncbi:TPA: hypothetical protein ACPZ06_001109 [Klebsiella pneumoniae]